MISEKKEWNWRRAILAEIETKPDGSRVKIRDVVRKVEPGVEPTICCKTRSKYPG